MNIGELANTSGSILERISEKALTIPNNCAFHAEALPNDKFDVLFEDGTSLLSLLPEGVRFAQTTSNIPSANVGWKKDGTVELMEIVGNPSLVAKEHPQYLSLFSHEIGHVLALFEEAKFWANPDIAPKSETETLADLYQNIQFSLYAGSLAWKVELEAWNHGKVVYQLDGWDISGGARLAYAESALAARYLLDQSGPTPLVALLTDIGASVSFTEAFNQRILIPYQMFAANWAAQAR